ncbi:MAG: hypothetical protein ACE5E6_12230 [Phycisphaerae bacterium]
MSSAPPPQKATLPAPSGPEATLPGAAAAPIAITGKSVASHTRWWVGVGAGTLVSIPIAWWLLYPAALLIFYLGLFFFALFGLVIGAVTYRIASPGRPYRRTAVVWGTTIIVGVCWATSMLAESTGLADTMSRKAVDDWPTIGDRTVADVRTEVAGQIRSFLADRYPPGGVIGYARWALRSGELNTTDIAGVKRKTLKLRQHGWGWGLRVVFTVALLAFGVASQTLPLATTDDGASCPPVDGT